MKFIYINSSYWEAFQEKVLPTVTQYGLRILMAIILFLIGRLAIKKAIAIMNSRMKLEHIDTDVQPFLVSLVRAALNIMLVLSCAGVLGVETSSFIAALGAAGLAIGLALQGSLSNFAGGVLILVFKPFRVGELISVHGFTGYVESIQIFNTILLTTSHRTIVLPNGNLSTSAVENISRKGIIRVDMRFETDISADIDKTRACIEEVIERNPHVINERRHEIVVIGLKDTAIIFGVKLWIQATEIDRVQYFMYEHVKKQFDAHGIAFPDPVMAVKVV